MSSLSPINPTDNPPAKNLRLNWLALLIGLTLIRGLLYLTIFPPFLAPDESAHFEAIRLIGQENKWPTADVYAVTPMHPDMVATFENFRLWHLVGLYSPTRNLGVTDTLFINYYPTQIAGSEVIADAYLMFYHQLLAPLSGAMASFDLTSQVYGLRSVSVLFAAGSISVAWLTLRALFPNDEKLALAVGAFIVFWPMHTHVTASITVDALTELLASIFFMAIVRIYLQGITIRWGVVLLGAMFLAMLTKPTAFFLLPTLIAAILVYLGRYHLTRLARYTLPALGVMVIAVLVASIVLHQNSEGGRRISSILLDGLIIPNWATYFSKVALNNYISALNFAVLSFAGLFGWSNIHIPWAWVKIWALIFGAVSLGGLIFIYRQLIRPQNAKGWLSKTQHDVLIIFLLSLIFSWIGVITPIIATQSPSWGIHSRYYFPATIPFGLYFFLATRQLIPARFERWVLPTWVIGWISYDTIVLFGVILPYLYS